MSLRKWAERWIDFRLGRFHTAI